MIFNRGRRLFKAISAVPVGISNNIKRTIPVLRRDTRAIHFLQIINSIRGTLPLLYGSSEVDARAQIMPQGSTLCREVDMTNSHIQRPHTWVIRPSEMLAPICQ